MFTCQYCGEEITKNIRLHEKACYMNPLNVRLCEVCGKPIKKYKTSLGACSLSCANSLHRKGENNPNWSGKDHKAICFKNHEHKCIICGEELMVEVHHLDGDKEHNIPANLIPLCPTHHRYWHSKQHRHLIESVVYKYMWEFSVEYIYDLIETSPDHAKKLPYLRVAQ